MPSRPCFPMLKSAAFVLPVLIAARVWGLQESTPPVNADPAVAPEDPPEAPAPRDEVSTTQHVINLAGRDLAYVASAGTIPLKKEDGTVLANVFYIAYALEREAEEDDSLRPITFCFNGGPGSSSVWLHLGAFGPKRVDMGDAGALTPPPWKLVDNDATLLDVTDLVFIDPVTTGYSRAADDQDAKQFHGVNEDIESVGEFIRMYTTRSKRWDSPKFLAGESYGTTRAAGLAGHLQDRHGMFLSGIVLVSSILNFQTARFDRGNDLPHVLFLPTMTATAWYHHQLEDDLQRDLAATLAAVEDFALNEYSLALMQGADLGEDDRRRIAATLARYTGVAVERIEQANLRLRQDWFCKELLRDQRRTVGRLDSRFVGIDADAAGASTSYDPSYAAIQGPFTATLNAYMREELEFKSDLPYEILTGRVQPWNYGDARNQYLNVAETLRSAMTENQSLRVFVASGYFDFATPYFATDYTMSHLGLEAELEDHITTTYYESGHMMYIHEPSRAKLKAELAKFYQGALAR